MIERLLKARENKTAVERPTRTFPDLSVERAYQLQRQLIDKLLGKGETIAGYKLSPKTVKSPDDPYKMIPVYGYLFESMKLPVGAILKRSDFIDLHLENEIAFIVGKEIDPKKIKTPSDLKRHIKLVAPAIEMPEIHYSGPIDDVTGLDLVVDNVAASRFIIGNGILPQKIDADSVAVKMTRNGVVVNEGISTMVEGSPWKSLFWLVKKFEKEGKVLEPEQVILTGGIARFMDSDPGFYEATYEGLGKITFTINE